MKRYFLRFWPLYCLTAAIVLFAVGVGSRAVTTVVNHTPLERSNVVIIDAGHGGEDGGATSCTGVLESQLNLEIALRLDALLHLLGYETKMIRTADISIYTEGSTIAAKKASDLRNRVKIVNGTENGLLVSIHQNLFPDSRYNGAQVFYNKVEGARELAQSMQTVFVASVNPGSNRKIKQSDGVYLMEHICRPGILVECGFLSNPEEEVKLRTGEYQKKICCVIASVLSEYFTS